jgi:hypothetical protein
MGLKNWFQKKVGAAQEGLQKKADGTRKAFDRAFQKKKEEAREQVRLDTKLQDLKTIQKKIDSTYGMTPNIAQPTLSAGGGGDLDCAIKSPNNSSSTSWEKLAEARVFCATCRCECCKVVTGEDTSLRGHCMFWWSADLHAEVRREKEAAKKAKAETTAAQETASSGVVQTDRGPRIVRGSGGMDTLNSGFSDGPPIVGPMLSQALIDFGGSERQVHPPSEAIPAAVAEESPNDNLVSSEEDFRTTPPDMRRFNDVRRGLSLARNREVLEDSMAFE